MVLPLRSPWLALLSHCDPRRVAGFATAVTVNLLALLLLSLPGSGPTLRLPPIVPSTPIFADVISRRPVEPLPEAAPAPPRAPERPAPVKRQPVQIATPTVPAEAASVETSVLPAVDAPAHSVADPSPGPVGDREAQLAYDWAPPPPYPHIALSRGLQGTVLLSVLVAPDGSVQEVRVQRGSGHRVLDREALRHVRAHWRFQPALRGGQPVAAWASVPVQFRIAE